MSVYIRFDWFLNSSGFGWMLYDWNVVRMIVVVVVVGRFRVSRGISILVVVVLFVDFGFVMFLIVL